MYLLVSWTSSTRENIFKHSSTESSLLFVLVPSNLFLSQFFVLLFVQTSLYKLYFSSFAKHWSGAGSNGLFDLFLGET